LSHCVITDFELYVTLLLYNSQAVILNDIRDQDRHQLPEIKAKILVSRLVWSRDFYIPVSKFIVTYISSAWRLAPLRTKYTNRLKGTVGLFETSHNQLRGLCIRGRQIDVDVAALGVVERVVTGHLSDTRELLVIGRRRV